MSDRAKAMFADVLASRSAAERLAGARTAAADTEQDDGDNQPGGAGEPTVSEPAGEGMPAAPEPAPVTAPQPAETPAGGTGDPDTTAAEPGAADAHDLPDADETATGAPDGNDNPTAGERTPVAGESAPAKAGRRRNPARPAPAPTGSEAAGEPREPLTAGGGHVTAAPRLILPGVERVRVGYAMPAQLLIGLRRQQHERRVRGRRPGGNNELGQMVCEYIPTDIDELAAEIVNLETRDDLTGRTLQLACTIPADIHDLHGDLLLSLLEQYQINATRRLLWIVGADRRLRSHTRRR